MLFQPDTDKAAAIVFDKVGFETNYVTFAECCGAINHHLDAEQNALRQIKNNIDTWLPLVKSNNIEAITMTASGCGVLIKDYGHLLKHDSEYAEKAKTISQLYKDPVEIIQPHGRQVKNKQQHKNRFSPALHISTRHETTQHYRNTHGYRWHQPRQL